MTSQHLNINQTFDLTQSQLYFWAGQQLNVSSPLYNTPFKFDFYQAIDIHHFKKAFHWLVANNDSLKLCFFEKNGIPKQRIQSDIPDPLEIQDWSDQFVTEEQIEEWIEERSKRKIDISQKCFDSVLIQLSANRFIWFYNHHHISSDAWSISVMYKKMIELYQHAATDTLEQVKQLPSFIDYLEYESVLKQNSTRENIRDYWVQKQKQLPTPPIFYTPKEGEATTAATRVEVTLTKQQIEQFKSITSDNRFRHFTVDLTRFNLIATIIFAFLHRISNQKSLAFSTPAHNRTSRDFKDTLGLFIELFPLSIEVETEDTFVTLYKRVRNEINDFLKHAQAGASTAELNRRVNVVLNYINATFPVFNDVPVDTTWLHPDHADALHHLRFQVYDFTNSGDIRIFIDFNLAAFQQDTIEQAPNHFERILDGFLSDPEQKIGNVPLLASAEQSQIFKTLDQFEQAPQKTDTVVSLFEKQVSQEPNQIAIEFKGSTLTYAELNTKANQLAYTLKSKGIQTGDRVSIYFKRSPELLISILAVLKAGATYIPIGYELPQKRIQYLIHNSQSSLLISHSALIDHLAYSEIERIALDQSKDLLANQPKTNLGIPIEKDALAYIMYTSGSTGAPKGVMIPHSALSNYLQWAIDAYVQTEHPAFPLFTMIGFDLTVTSTFVPLLCGGKIVVYEETDSAPAMAILDVIQDNKVDVIKLTPSHLTLLEGQDLKHSRIRVMIVGGESLSTHLARTTIERFPKDLLMINEYGPTEATVGCIIHAFDPQNTPQSAVPIGLPAPGFQVFVLDDYGNPVPQGVTGELFISGKGLAKGYWNRADLTQERFINLPLHDAPLYRTGDLARLNAEGVLEFLGRKDRQIKYKGIRIELSEIESSLATVEDWKNVVVELVPQVNTPNQSNIYHCTKCGLPSNYPGATFAKGEVCHLCTGFEDYQKKTQSYFRTTEDFQKLFEVRPTDQGSEYDCISLLSGGKDSTYVLGQLVEMGLKVLAFTLDNGYISEQAKDNIRRVVDELGVDHVFGSTEAMNAIFVDSLKRHSNVCDGCFKTIYTLSTKLALEKNIPFIITGLSRGQFFETRLTEELFRGDTDAIDNIDQVILQARKAYHQVDDAVKQLLDTSMFDTDEVFEKVQFIDFFRYTDVTLNEMLDYLNHRLPWSRPSDTGRSTNCLINQVGIYVHKKEKGYNNYAFPYSWDVRIGHKNRDEALEEINEEVNENEVKIIMDEIGYVQSSDQNCQLIAFYTGDQSIDISSAKSKVSTLLPDYMIPTHYVHLPEIPPYHEWEGRSKSIEGLSGYPKRKPERICSTGGRDTRAHSRNLV